MAALGLSCSIPDLGPWPEIKPRPPVLGVQSLSHWTTREVPISPYLKGFLSEPGIDRIEYSSYIAYVTNGYLTLRWSAEKFFSPVVIFQSLSHVWLFATPWTTVCQASLSIINSWNLLKLMSTESVMPSNHLILCHPLFLLPSIFPSIRVFSNQLALRIRWLATSASSSVLPMNIQGWFPLGLIGLISLQSKGLSRVFSSTTVQKCQFFNAKPSLWSTSDLECKMKFHVPGRAMGSLSVLGVGVGSQGKIKWKQGTCEGSRTYSDTLREGVLIPVSVIA